MKWENDKKVPYVWGSHWTVIVLYVPEKHINCLNWRNHGKFCLQFIPYEEPPKRTSWSRPDQHQKTSTEADNKIKNQIIGRSEVQPDGFSNLNDFTRTFLNIVETKIAQFWLSSTKDCPLVKRWEGEVKVEEEDQLALERQRNGILSVGSCYSGAKQGYGKQYHLP